MNRAEFIVCRSGYTTVMELAEIEKKHALFIPTRARLNRNTCHPITRVENGFIQRASMGWIF